MTSARARLIESARAAGLPAWYTRLKLCLMPLESWDAALPPGGVVLDVGCGVGYVAGFLAQAHPERRVVAYDPDAARVRTAAALLAGQGNAQAVVADRPPVNPGTASGAVIADILHHVPFADQADVLRAVREAMKPDARLVVRETNRRWSVRYMLFHVLLEGLLYLGKEKMRFRTAAVWELMLADAGFEVLEQQSSPWWFPYITVTFLCRARA